DGIRYRNVTGVQTCALPIWSLEPRARFRLVSPISHHQTALDFVLRAGRVWLRCHSARSFLSNHRDLEMAKLGPTVRLDWHECNRSEERRVGKEWRLWCEMCE